MDCVFCKIVRGQIPSFKIYEDEEFLAFLDKFPQTPGHTQVIPKKHARWVWDTPHLGHYFEVCGKIALAMRKAFNTDFVQSRIIGDEVHHAHIWLIPMHKEKLSSEPDIVKRITSNL